MKYILFLLIITLYSCNTKTNFKDLYYDKSSNILFDANGKPFKGTCVTQLDDSRIETQYVDGIAHGSSITYDNNNIKIIESSYYRGTKNSNTKYFDPKGNIVSHDEYIKNRYWERK